MFSKNRIALLALTLSVFLAGSLVSPIAAQEIVPTQLLFDNEDGVDGMGGPRQVVTSPDSRFVYVPGESDSAIAVYSRNTATGQLTWVDSVVDGVDANGIFGCASISMPVNGQHLYATAAFGSSIAAFQRNPVDGTLTFVDAYFNGVDGVSGLASTVWSAVSPEGRHVYAAGFSDSSIVTFKRNRQTGELTYVGKTTGIPGVFTFELSPDGRHLYASSLTSNSIFAFERDQQTGMLTVVDIETDGVAGVDGLRSTRAVAVSGDGKNVYAAGLLDHAVVVFARDAATGQLTFQQVLSALTSPIPLFRATHVTVSRNGHKVYVAAFNSRRVAVFNRDLSTGLLTFAGNSGNPIAGRMPLDGAIGTAVSKDGHHLYAVGFFGQGLVVFDAQKN